MSTPDLHPDLKALAQASSRPEIMNVPAVKMHLDILNCTACTARSECDRPTPFWPRITPAYIMIVGRNPGINEDKEGRPFVGRGGQVFEAWLRGIGLSREQIWLTNTMKCYTNKDRKPKQKELDTCWDLHLSKEIAHCQPHLIVALGAEAFTTFTGLDRLSHRHGILYDRRDSYGAYVMGVIHPGSALRDNSFMQAMIDDAKRLKPIVPIALSGQMFTTQLPEGYELQ